MHVQNIYKHWEIYISNFSIGEETTLFWYTSSFYISYFQKLSKEIMITQYIQSFDLPKIWIQI